MMIIHYSYTQTQTDILMMWRLNISIVSAFKKPILFSFEPIRTSLLNTDRLNLKITDMFFVILLLPMTNEVLPVPISRLIACENSSYPKYK